MRLVSFAVSKYTPFYITADFSNKKTLPDGDKFVCIMFFFFKKLRSF